MIIIIINIHNGIKTPVAVLVHLDLFLWVLDASLGENDADLSQSQSDAPSDLETSADLSQSQSDAPSDLETSMAEESQPPAEAVEPASEVCIQYGSTCLEENS